MSLSTLFRSESPVLIKDWSKAFGSDSPPPVKTETRQSNIHIGSFSVKPSNIAAAHQDFADLELELESDDSNREGLAAAAVWVADRFYPDEQNTVRTVRLRRGLSQKQLATIIGSSQPHVANIEKGSVNVMFNTVLRLCDALAITPNDFQCMIENQQKINSRKEPK